MTIEELYGKLTADDALKAELAEAAKEGKVADWAAAQGVETTEEELLSYARAAATDGQELTDEQLERVAGGGYWTVTASIAYVEPACFED